MDPDYDMKEAVTKPTITNVDNNSNGVSVSLISGNTREATPTVPVFFVVSLSTYPGAGNDVSVDVASTVPLEGEPNVTTVVVPADDWNAGVRVYVFGKDDDVGRRIRLRDRGCMMWIFFFLLLSTDTCWEIIRLPCSPFSLLFLFGQTTTTNHIKLRYPTRRVLATLPMTVSRLHGRF